MSFFKVKIQPGGKVTIPLPLRRRLNYKVGDELIVRLNEEELTLHSTQKNLKDFQTQIKQRMKELEEDSRAIDSSVGEEVNV